jgi:hypothetical protein
VGLGAGDAPQCYCLRADCLFLWGIFRKEKKRWGKACAVYRYIHTFVSLIDCISFFQLKMSNAMTTIFSNEITNPFTQNELQKIEKWLANRKGNKEYYSVVPKRGGNGDLFNVYAINEEDQEELYLFSFDRDGMVQFEY